MIAGPALPCPKCRRSLEPLSWHGTDRGSCWHCKTDFEFVAFPALTATRPKVVPQAVLVAEHATCFYHAENQAEAVCEGCGRFVCVVCAVDFNGQRVCPSCIAASRATDERAVSQRTLFGGIVLVLATLPVLLWPVTCVTAPLALGLAIYGWNKPGSLLGGGRVKLVIGSLFATAQICGWGFMLVNLLFLSPANR